MRIKDLGDLAPRWLRNAIVEHENVEIQNGIVIWLGGIWYNGDWYGGAWHGGAWYGGDWYGGAWHSGAWHGGAWHGGAWYGGAWHGGAWYGGDWHGGIWYNGDWYSGAWHSGAWHGGAWHGGAWYGGAWHDGAWYGGAWHSGAWHGGAWHGGAWYGGAWLDERVDQLMFMASLCGIVFDESGTATAYRSTAADGSGRYTTKWKQPEGEYYEDDLPSSGSGTCIRGIHVTSQGLALTYFGIDPLAQLWRVRFKREDLLDCDGQKARIRGGIFEKIAWPFFSPNEPSSR